MVVTDAGDRRRTNLQVILCERSRPEVSFTAPDRGKAKVGRGDDGSQTGGRRAAAAWAEGKAMPLGRAVEYAFSEEVDREPPTTFVPAPEQQPAADEPAEGLTPREREVALLVGRGLTNRRIARELSISESTVANHVVRILKKLGLRSRAQIAAWVTQGRRRSPS